MGKSTRSRWAVVGAALMVVATAEPARAQSTPCSTPTGRPWCDAAIPTDQRARLFTQALTQDEKVLLLAGTTPPSGSPSSCRSPSGATARSSRTSPR